MFTYSHVGICVSDLDRSLRFYCDGLGFEKAETYPIGSEFAAALEVEGDLELTSQFIRRDGVAIELLYYASPGVLGEPSSRRNQLGITHLSFIVEDVDASAAKLVAAGATILEDTRTDLGIQIVFLADPDGTRIELMTAP
jgi:catechol 2,3-dioxygenase-like lactoylglutathione lyase family enzyme